MLFATRIKMFRLVRGFEVNVAPEVRCATKVNSPLSLHFAVFPEVVPREPFSKKRRDSDKLRNATKTQRFEVVRDNEPVLKYVVQRKRTSCFSLQVEILSEDLKPSRKKKEWAASAF